MVHTIFFQLCGVEESGRKGKRTGDLCGVIPLDTGAPFEVVEEREVWHPNWRGKVDDTVNAQFLKAAVVLRPSCYLGAMRPPMPTFTSLLPYLYDRAAYSRLPDSLRT